MKLLSRTSMASLQRTLGSATVVAGVTIFAACGAQAVPGPTGGTASPTAATSSASQAALQIGLLASQTGPVGSQGVLFANGAKLALDQVNKSGGVKGLNGRKLEFVQLDDQSQPAVARTSAIQLMTQNKAPAIIGPYGAGTCLAAAAVAEEYKVPMICSAADDAPTSQGYHYIFNMGTTGTTYAKTVWSFVRDLNQSGGAPIQKVAVLYEDGTYGTGINGNLVKYAPANMQIVSSLSFKAGTADLGPLVNRAKGGGAQVIVLAAFAPDMVNTLRAVQTTGATGMLVVGFAGAVIAPGVLGLGTAANGVVAMTNWNSQMRGRPELAKFVSDYQAAYGSPPSADSAAGYIAVGELVAGIDAAASAEATKIRDGILKESVVIPITNGYTSKFDPSGVMSSQEEMVLAAQLQDGQWQTVWPNAVSTAALKRP